MAPKTTVIIDHRDGAKLEDYKDHANNLLYQYYESSPTALKDIPMSEKELGDITYYNRIATGADAPKK